MTLLFAALMQTVLFPGGGTATYNEAYKASQASGQPLVVLIGADWCPGCRTMKDSVMPQVRAAGGLNNVAYAQVNTDQEQALASKMMSGGTIPQLIMYYETADGWQRKQMSVGSAEEVTAFVNRGVAASASFVAAKKAQPESAADVVRKTSTPAGSR